MDFSVAVLTSGIWPFQSSPELRLPSELASCVDRFTAFYAVRGWGRV